MSELLNYVVIVAVLAVGLLSGCRTQQSRPQPASAGEEAGSYAQRAPSPSGIGKVYMGREVGQVRGHEALAWLERDERARTELPARLVRALDLQPSDVVADVGAGTGYFTFRLAPEVPRGLVYAVDIQQAMIDTLGARMHRRGAENVRPHHGTIMNPRLPEGALDLALIVDAYHEFSHPREMMQALYADLKPGGRLVVVEYRAEDPTVSADPLHRMSERQILREMQAAGFAWRETLDVLPQQHLVVFEKPVG